MDILDTGVHVCKLAQLIGNKAAEFCAANGTTPEEKLKRVSAKYFTVLRIHDIKCRN